MNRRIVWRWFHVRTLKYAEVMLRNQKMRDCIMQKYFRFDASSCIIRSVFRYFHKLYIHLKRISCRIEWFLFQLHSPKHARVIIIILLMIRKAIVLAFRSQGVKQCFNYMMLKSSTHGYTVICCCKIFYCCTVECPLSKTAVCKSNSIDVPPYIV